MAITISHPGVVEAIDDDSVFVRMEVAEACGACRARAACGLGDEHVKLVVVIDPRRRFEKGEEVLVVMQQHLGPKAVLVAYLLPLLVLLAALLISIQLLPEGAAGLLSLGVLALYYAVLFLQRRRLERVFDIYLQKVYKPTTNPNKPL